MNQKQDLYREMLSLKIFNDETPQFLKFGNQNETIKKTKIWTMPILTTQITDLIKNFAKSNYPKISDYFNFYINYKNGENIQAKEKFCRTFFVSLLFFARQNYAIEKYYEIFQNYESHQMYEFFNQTKISCLQMQNINRVAFVDLEQVFMDFHERTYILNQIFGYKEKQQREFNQLMMKVIDQNKFRKQKLVKGEEINLSFFLICCLNQFANSNRDPLTQQNEIQKIKTRLTILSKDAPRRDTGMLQRMTLIMSKGLLNDYGIDDQELMMEQIKIKKSQLRIILKNKFAYKDSFINLISVQKGIDVLLEELKSQINKQYDELKGVKLNMSVENQEKFEEILNPEIRSSLYTGSELKSDILRKFLSSILKIDQNLYSDINDRVDENWIGVRANIQRLKKQLFLNHSNLCNIDGFNLDELKSEFVKLELNQNPNTTDLEILQMIQNGSSIDNSRVFLTQVLLKNSWRLQDQISKITNDNKQDIQKEWDRITDNLNKINQMDDFQFHQEHQQDAISSYQKRLNSIIEQQISDQNSYEQYSQKSIIERLTQQLENNEDEQPINENVKRNFVKNDFIQVNDEIIEENDYSNSSKKLFQSESQQKEPLTKLSSTEYLQNNQQSEIIDTDEENIETTQIVQIDNLENDENKGNFSKKTNSKTSELYRSHQQSGEENFNDEGSVLVESELNESEVLKKDSDAQMKLHQKIMDRQTLMRDSKKPSEGFGRESYNLSNLILHRKGQKKFEQ